tara:strand:+ start:181 stop:666 length:486 start_codon:yes stop_codon:yes gene_type:complete
MTEPQPPMQVKTSAFVICTATQWISLAGLGILVVVIFAPPGSFARLWLQWSAQNPLLTLAILAAALFSVLSACLFRARSVKIQLERGLLHYQIGNIVRKTQSIRISDIQNVTSKQNITEQKLGAVTLKLETIGTGGVDLKLPQLKKGYAEELKKRIFPQIN